MPDAIVALLRCPISGQPLRLHEDAETYLETADGAYRYPVDGGIALLLAEHAQSMRGSSTQAE